MKSSGKKARQANSPDNAVSSRGCSRHFIVTFLHQSLSYVAGLPHSPDFPFNKSLVQTWLCNARDICQQSPETYDLYGGIPFSIHDMGSYWTEPQQFFTWWKNNVERKSKFRTLQRDASAYVTNEKGLKRAFYCATVIALSTNIRQHFERNRVAYQNTTVPGTLMEIPDYNIFAREAANRSPILYTGSPANSSVGSSSPVSYVSNSTRQSPYNSPVYGSPYGSPSGSPIPAMTDLEAMHLSDLRLPSVSLCSRSGSQIGGYNQSATSQYRSENSGSCVHDTNLGAFRHYSIQEAHQQHMFETMMRGRLIHRAEDARHCQHSGCSCCTHQCKKQTSHPQSHSSQFQEPATTSGEEREFNDLLYDISQTFENEAVAEDSSDDELPFVMETVQSLAQSVSSYKPPRVAPLSLHEFSESDSQPGHECDVITPHPTSHSLSFEPLHKLRNFDVLCDEQENGSESETESEAGFLKASLSYEELSDTPLLTHSPKRSRSNSCYSDEEESVELNEGVLTNFRDFDANAPRGHSASPVMSRTTHSTGRPLKRCCSMGHHETLVSASIPVDELSPNSLDCFTSLGLSPKDKPAVDKSVTVSSKEMLEMFEPNFIYDIASIESI